MKPALRASLGVACAGGAARAVLAAAMLLCAAAQAQDASPPRSPTDPLEGFNRGVFVVNEAVDQYLLKPLAEGYRKVTPEVLRTGVDNVFGNFSDLWSTANHFLQGKVTTGFEMGMRVVSNTVFGIGGVFDVATEMGLERRSEDFGQTLGVWGFGPGPYLMLPLLGPSTVRDTAALPLDMQLSPVMLTDDAPTQGGIQVLRVLNTRANLLGATSLIDGVALDKYVFLRDAYLARRRNQVYDGNPPEPPEEAEEPPAAASGPAR